MGYTHYWTRVAPWPAEAVRSVIKDMGEVISRCEILLRDWEGKGLPEVSEGRIRFNGVGEESHETFIFDLKVDPKTGVGGFQQRDGRYYFSDFAFCKTFRKPYDTVVVACLLVAKHHLGTAIEVRSDGDWDDEWHNGVAPDSPSGVKVYEHIFPNRAPVANILDS